MRPCGGRSAAKLPRQRSTECHYFRGWAPGLHQPPMEKQMIKPFAHTAKGLPLCLVPSTAPNCQCIWRVLLCGVQIAEAFHREGAAFVCPFSPNDEVSDFPEVQDSIVFGPDADQRMREALDGFAAAFLAAAESEQLRLQILEAQ